MYLVSCFSSSFNPIKDKFQLLFQIMILFWEPIKYTSCLNDFQMKSDLNLNNF